VVPWSVEQVLAVAPARTSAARPLAVPALWDLTGADDRSAWGRFRGGSGEPYQVLVDHAPGEERRDIGTRCTCPSRVSPCKHAIALLVLWANGQVARAVRPPTVEAWLNHRDAQAASRPSPVASTRRPPPAHEGTPSRDDPGTAGPTARESRPVGSDTRVERVTLGLRELERWIDDRVRVGLGDPSIARYATWDEVATRLVDAQAGGMANRVRRLAGQVGARPGWHAHVVAELGVLHLLARAGQRLRDLDDPWADGVSAAIGFTVKQADVLAGVPDTGVWVVMGRSDIVEDRIVVRRLWLRDSRPEPSGPTAGWAVLLSFAAYGQSLDDSLAVGHSLHADLHRYPGTVPLRALLGRRYEPVLSSDDRDVPDAAVVADPVSLASPSVAAALGSVGAMLAVEPWLERVPVTLTASPTVHDGMWVLADHTGAVPLADPSAGGTTELAALLAASTGGPVTVTGEWTALGLAVLTVHLADRTLDIGPRGGFR
jgi:hypothetical protein